MGRTISNTGANTSNSTIGDDAINVTSAGGFSAGDYVYYNNGDYMTPGNSTFTTANFPLNLTMPVRTGVASGGDSWIVATNATNARTANATAKLSNGNIVIAYAGVVDSGGFRSYPCFKIIDENGNVIVSETQIEAAAVGTSFYTLACVALSGGGFAIGWVTSGNQFRYAIYSNAGAVVTAVATDTGVLINSNASQCMLSMAARPVSGGFVLALVSSTGQAAYKVYSSTGAQTYAWTTTGLFGSSTTITSTFVTCRSDDSLVITGYDNVANTIMYQVFSSTNTSVVASTVAASSIYTGSYTSGHCATLTNDSVVIVYSASGGIGTFKILTSGNVLGSALTYSNSSVVSGGGRVLGLSSGNFVIFYPNITTTNYLPSSTPIYAVFNSSGTLITTANGSGAGGTSYLPNAFISVTYNSDYNFGSVVETSTFITFFCNGPKRNQIDPGGFVISAMKVNKTTYSPVIQYSQTIPGASVSAAVSAVNKTGSTPMLAGYTASSTSFPVVTDPVLYGSTQTSPTIAGYAGSSGVVDPAIVYAQSCAAMPNGNVAVLWVSYGSTVYGSYPAKLAIYNPEGGLVNSVFVAATGGYSYPSVSLAVLDNNKIIVQLYRTTYIYSSTLAQIATVVNANISASPGVAALTGNRYVVGYGATSPTYLSYSVYDENGNILVNNAQADGGTAYTNSSYPIIVCGTVNGGFVMQYWNGTDTTLLWLLSSGTNTWVKYSSYVTGTGYYPGGASNNRGIFSTPDGCAAFSFNNASFAFIVREYYPQNNTSVFSFSATGTSGQTAAGSGNVVIDGYCSAGLIMPDGFYGNSVYIQKTLGSNTSSGTNTGYFPTPAMFGTSSPYASMSVAPLAGHRIMIFYGGNTGSGLAYCIVNTGTTTVQNSIISGTTTGTAEVSPNTGYVFTGVAASTATAGGSGVVQVNGQAQLNSSYSATTPATYFDSTNATSFGTKGTVVGRTVSMQRNS